MVQRKFSFGQVFLNTIMDDLYNLHKFVYEGNLFACGVEINHNTSCCTMGTVGNPS